MRNVFLGAGSRLARYVPNESSRQMVKESVAHLQRGGCLLLLFPEGTRTTRAPINSLVGSVGSHRQTRRRTGANADHRDRFAVLEQGVAAVPASRSAHRLPGAAGQRFDPPAGRPASPPRSTSIIGASSRAHCSPRWLESI